MMSVATVGLVESSLFDHSLVGLPLHTIRPLMLPSLDPSHDVAISHEEVSPSVATIDATPLMQFSFSHTLATKVDFMV